MTFGLRSTVYLILGILTAGCLMPHAQRGSGLLIAWCQRKIPVIRKRVAVMIARARLRHSVKKLLARSS